MGNANTRDLAILVPKERRTTTGRMGDANKYAIFLFSFQKKERTTNGQRETANSDLSISFRKKELPRNGKAQRQDAIFLSCSKRKKELKEQRVATKRRGISILFPKN